MPPARQLVSIMVHLGLFSDMCCVFRYVSARVVFFKRLLEVNSWFAVPGQPKIRNGLILILEDTTGTFSFADNCKSDYLTFVICNHPVSAAIQVDSQCLGLQLSSCSIGLEAGVNFE
jgi:hypothetical protein